MKKALVSVIVPNYNYARYLELRMESILNQTYDDYEVIILDDKSTDNSLEVINKYRSHPKVAKVIINEVNSGSPFKQWERGINEASGDIIWIAESDDYCTPDFLETLVPLYVKSEAVLAFCHSELVDENGKKLRENHQMKNVSSDFSMDGKGFIQKYLAYSNEVQNASCAIFSKKASLEIDKHYMDFKGAGDWLFWIEIAEKGNVSYVKDELNSYRLHRKSTSSTNGIGLKEMILIYQRLYSNGYLNNKALRKCRKNNLLLISSLQIISDGFKKELYEMWKTSPIELLILSILRLVKKIKKNRSRRWK